MGIYRSSVKRLQRIDEKSGTWLQKHVLTHICSLESAMKTLR